MKPTSKTENKTVKQKSPGKTTAIPAVNNRSKKTISTAGNKRKKKPLPPANSVPQLQPLATPYLLENMLDNQDLKQHLHLSEGTIRRWRKIRLLPYIKICKRIYYTRKDIENLLQRSYHSGKQAS